MAKNNLKQSSGLFKQVYIFLLSFSGSLATKYVSLINELFMTRPTLIDLNPVELNHYLFVVTQINIVEVVMQFIKCVFTIKEKT